MVWEGGVMDGRFLPCSPVTFMCSLPPPPPQLSLSLVMFVCSSQRFIAALHSPTNSHTHTHTLTHNSCRTVHNTNVGQQTQTHKETNTCTVQVVVQIKMAEHGGQESYMYEWTFVEVVKGTKGEGRGRRQW